MPLYGSNLSKDTAFAIVGHMVRPHFYQEKLALKNWYCGLLIGSQKLNLKKNLMVLANFLENVLKR